MSEVISDIPCPVCNKIGTQKRDKRGNTFIRCSFCESVIWIYSEEGQKHVKHAIEAGKWF